MSPATSASAGHAPDTVPALLAERTARSPDAVAFQVETAPGRWSPVTWAVFARRVERLRRALVAAGLRKGDRLVLIAPVSIEWELLHHAAMAAGVVVAGMDGHDRPERIAGMVELADVTAFAVSDPRALSCLPPERWARCRLAVALEGADAAWPAGITPIGLVALEALAPEESGQGPPLETPGPGDEAAIVFTSGTAGDPKGIAYRHHQVCLAIAAIADAFPFVGPGSRLLCWLPLSNLFQRIVNLAGMRRGAASYLLGDPRRVMDVVAGVAPEIFIGVPRFYEKLHEGIRARLASQPPIRRRLAAWAWDVGRLASPYLLRRAPMPAGLALRWTVAERLVLRRIRAAMGDRLRFMVTGSAPTPRFLLDELHALGWQLLEAYGMSENVLPMAINRPDCFRPGSVGIVTPGNEIEIAADGRVRVRGPGVFDAYLGEHPGCRRDADGFFTTGDLARLDAEGFVWLQGRVSDFVKTSTGRRIAPVPIEAALREVAGVDQVAVVGNRRRHLAALLTLTEDAQASAEGRAGFEAALRARLADLPGHERPAVVVVLDRALSIEEGELTPNLKLRRVQVESNHANVLDRAFTCLNDGAKGPDEPLLFWPRARQAAPHTPADERHAGAVRAGGPT
ncbi:MAG: AMP-binding protein [Burkholderiaceae bacterium]|jgi:long-chain acyl-CoA synthetase|nr:AMP-binding protein [Burkholderiaceae bacterium]